MSWERYHYKVICSILPFDNFLAVRLFLSITWSSKHTSPVHAFCAAGTVDAGQPIILAS